MATDKAPFAVRLSTDAEAVALGVDASEALVCPVTGVVTAVTYTPAADITGAATHYRTFSVLNKGLDGDGTAVVASLAFDSGAVTATDYNETPITLSATPANLQVESGDVLEWRSAKVGNGIADPGGVVTISISRE